MNYPVRNCTRFRNSSRRRLRRCFDNTLDVIGGLVHQFFAPSPDLPDFGSTDSAQPVRNLPTRSANFRCLASLTRVVSGIAAGRRSRNFQRNRGFHLTTRILERSRSIRPAAVSPPAETAGQDILHDRTKITSPTERELTLEEFPMFQESGVSPVAVPVAECPRLVFNRSCNVSKAVLVCRH